MTTENEHSVRERGRHTYLGYVVPVIVGIVVILVGVAIFEQTQLLNLGWEPEFSGLIATGSVAVGTAILAFVTWLSINQTKRERGLTEETIDEMRKDRQKPGIVSLIANEIDPLDAELVEGHSNLDVQWEVDEFDAPPAASTMERDVRVEEEIANVVPPIADHFEKYHEISARYEKTRSQLDGDIQRYVREELYDGLTQQKVDEIESVIEKFDLENQGSALRESRDPPAKTLIRIRESEIREWFLHGGPENPEDFRALWDVLKNVLREERMDGRFTDILRSLNGDHAELLELNQSLRDELDTARGMYIDEYGIIESEIKEKRNETQ